MGQEQSLPQETNEPDNKNNIINTTTNNTIENDNDKNVKENIDNNDASLNKLADSNSEIGNSKPSDNLSNSNNKKNYKNPMKTMNSLLKSYKSSRDFYSLNIIENLINLSSATKYYPDHDIWNSLLKKEKIPIINTKQASFDLNIVINLIGAEMVKNNNSTKNFTRLILFIISELNKARKNEYKNEMNLESRNALYILKLFSKYFIENISSDKIKELFDNYEPSEIIQDTHTYDTNNNEKKLILPIDESVINDKKPNLDLLMIELLNALTYLPLSNEKNIDFYEEVLSAFIIYSATRYHNNNVDNVNKADNANKSDNDKNVDDADNANNTDNDKNIDDADNANNTDNDKNVDDANNANNANDVDDADNKNNNILLITVFNVLSEQENENLAGKVITRLLTNLMNDNDQREGLFARVLRINSTNLSSISRKSLYTFLILTNQQNQLAKNKLSNLVNGLSNTSESNELHNTKYLNLKISFQSLYTLIYEKLIDNEEICLLLYQLISQNDAFRSFVLSKIDPELLLLPMLQSLYGSFKDKINFNKIYTLLITLLIMSQDEIYTETLQRIEINHPSWLNENNLKKISLSNLILSILLKIIHINLGKYKDIYLHSICLAIITNLALKMDNIHYYVAQKLMSLLELVQKKYFKIREQSIKDGIQNEEDMELQINEDLIMLLLEIINSCIINSLKTNLQLVYSVMRGKDVINHLKDIERFKEPAENIIYTIDFFESKIVFAEDLPSSNEIMVQIIQISKSWEPNKLKKTETIKFKFEEEKDYSLFFLPYIYNLIYSNTFFFNH